MAPETAKTTPQAGQEVDGTKKKRSRPARGQRRYRREVKAADDLANSKEAGVPATRGVSWRVTAKAGGRISDKRVIFTADSSRFITFNATRIKVFNTSTGLPLHVLSLSSYLEQAVCTAVQPNPANPLQLYTASSDGIIRLWNIEGGSLVQFWDVGEHITDMVINPKQPKYAYVITQSEEKTASETTARSVKYTCHRFGFETRKKKVLLKTKKPLLALEASADGNYMAVASRAMAAVFDTDSLSELSRYESDEEITSLAVHPTGQSIAVGDIRGRITIWYNVIATSKQNAVREVLHWHPHRVNDLAFTSDGGYLLSGGNEMVLVVWQLRTRHKQFLPRLGSEIFSIAVSPDQTSYALYHKDNTVRLISAINLTVKRVVTGLQFATSIGDQQTLRTGLLVEPKSKAIVLEGYPGHLQFYDVADDSSVLQVEVIPNPVSQLDDGNGSRINARITHVAFSADAAWMATSEERTSIEDGQSQNFLKFWEYDENAQSYKVVTRMDQPHKGPITSLKISGTSLIAVTTSEDGTFKIWQLAKTAHSDVKEHWLCTSWGTYQNLPAYDATFSNDGSIIAIAFGQLITIWDAFGSRLHGVLASPLPRSPIRRVRAVGTSHLISCTDDRVYVWNLLSCTLLWSLRLHVHSIAVDPSQSRFVVLAHEDSLPGSKHSPAIRRTATRLLIFETGSPTPLASSSLAVPCFSAVFRPKKAESDLVLLNQNGELEVLSQNDTEGPRVVKKIEEQPSSRTSLTNLYQNQPTQPTAQPYKATSAIVFDISAPSHVLPPPTQMIMSFLNSFMVPRVSDDTVVDAITEKVEEAETVEETVDESDGGLIKREAVDIVFKEVLVSV
ncbi:uncharacterized protein SPPG_01833 [Spizellomyces punctatus DAOM BR117]|uniref:WD repeat-containing protein 75 second beta-propeller domain-containing protein n=1 Tax=Spizellomyces punctatus (strain DAOM BR117) TaxID=645134 RepID=A0A0L0HP58_SPIPD|nr:uncharacterized protein SPPG_01833 [Spizellomyces punctatus DAOM BR117]KND02750.1 hypothetical protein SPPG_01833 [Spizellomyces punctatus DAOM BR117]|eukprot:XP_016610789.1 hypothetical protein SPPG_01833 [Spizellomyces punctatus DAOM BR117]